MNSFLRVNMKHARLWHVEKSSLLFRLHSSLCASNIEEVHTLSIYRMTEAVSVKPYEHPPSRIPVPTRRASLNVDSLILQQHAAANGQVDGRPGSGSATSRPGPSRRPSLMLSAGSRKSSFTEKNRDPGEQLQTLLGCS